eukprot:756692-Hanusia_phi.AAC.7
MIYLEKENRAWEDGKRRLKQLCELGGRARNPANKRDRPTDVQQRLITRTRDFKNRKTTAISPQAWKTQALRRGSSRATSEHKNGAIGGTGYGGKQGESKIGKVGGYLHVSAQGWYVNLVGSAGGEGTRGSGQLEGG